MPTYRVSLTTHIVADDSGTAKSKAIHYLTGKRYLGDGKAHVSVAYVPGIEGECISLSGKALHSSRGREICGDQCTHDSDVFCDRPKGHNGAHEGPGVGIETGKRLSWGDGAPVYGEDAIRPNTDIQDKPSEARGLLADSLVHNPTPPLEQVAQQRLWWSALNTEAKRDLTLRELQTKLPWTTHYHRDFRSNPQTHKDFQHAMIHAMKALGKLSAVVNRAEHGGDDFIAEDVNPYVADLVLCALRMANTCPGKIIDLADEVVERINSKNEVQI